MSYEKCKSIVLKLKTNQIFITSASNNVSPITYYKSEYAAGSKCALEDKILYLMNSMLDGNIQISQLNKNTIPFEYALIKLRKYYRENNINEYGDKYDKRYELYEKELSKYVNVKEWAEVYKFKQQNKELVEKIDLDIRKSLYEQEFKLFQNAIKEEVEGKYYLKDDFGRVIEYVCDTKYGFKYRAYEFPNENCLMDYKLACIRKEYMGSKFEIRKLDEIEKQKNLNEEEEENIE